MTNKTQLQIASEYDESFRRMIEEDMEQFDLICENMLTKPTTFEQQDALISIYDSDTIALWSSTFRERQEIVDDIVWSKKVLDEKGVLIYENEETGVIDRDALVTTLSLLPREKFNSYVKRPTSKGSIQTIRDIIKAVGLYHSVAITLYDEDGFKENDGGDNELVSSDDDDLTDDEGIVKEVVEATGKLSVNDEEKK